MEITLALLIYLGFDWYPDRPYRYYYKGIAGRLVEATGHFYFLCLSLLITRELDLRFQLMLILITGLMSRCLRLMCR